MESISIFFQNILVDFFHFVLDFDVDANVYSEANKTRKD